MSLATLLNKIKEGGNNSAPDATSSAFKVLGATSTVNATDHSQILLNRNLFLALSDLYHSLDSKYDPSIARDDALAILEDVCIGKKVILTRNYQGLINGIYGIIIKQSPGYVIRNILLSMINVLNHKLSTPFGKECVIEIINQIILSRVNDCGSQISEVFTNINKLVRANEAIVRIASMKCLVAIVKAEDGKLSDLYVEIVKIIPKTIVDRVVEVRKYTAELAENLCVFSDGFTVFPADAIQPYLQKALEDENAIVQEAIIKAYATIFEIQLNAYLEKQEQSKIGAARGGSDSSTPAKAKQPAPSRLSFAAKLPSLKKVVVEEHADYRTIIEKLIKSVTSSAGSAKVANIMVIGYVIANSLDKISAEDFEWTIQQFFAILHNDSIQSLTFEEQNFLRIRFSYVFRTFVVSKINESKQLIIAAELAKFSGGMDSSGRYDIEIQFALCELNHVLTVLGTACCAVADESNMAASTNLRHSSFGVRSAAANILLTISLTSPNAAVEFIHTATQNARKQMKELMTPSGSPDDNTPVSDEAFDESGESTPTGSIKKKTGKELERMQKMFFFHGQTLVLSLIVKNVKSLPCGLPTSVIIEVFELGLDMMNHDIKQTPQPLRHVACSIIRAGGLIISSCLGMGYEQAQLRMREVLTVCQKLVRLGEISPNSTSVRVDDLLFEMMCIEAGLLCLTALLLYSSEALLVENGCLMAVIDNLEFCFKAMKSKYQPNFRTHFRCRTLHITLLETYTLLPPGSYPNSSQQIYMEALRVLRDSISSGLECSPCILNDVEYSIYSEDLQEILSHFPFLTSDYVDSEVSLVLKLENYFQPLQKKESEAFLSVFGKDHHSAALLTKCVGFGSYHRHDDHLNKCGMHLDRISSQSCQIDSRTLDAALKLLGVTFSHQLPEYQDKAVQLFSQAIAQLSQNNQSSSGRMSLTNTAKGMGLFANDEERKKREKRNCITLRSVVCAFKSVVQNFPVHIGSVNSNEVDFAWRQTIIDHVYDLLTNSDLSIRRAAASTMALFSKKWRGTNIIASVCNRMRSAIVSTLEKKVDANIINDYVGYISTLGYLWIHCTDSTETRSLISTTLFDSLRKSDSSMNFQSHVFVSLSMICMAQLDHINRSSNAASLMREEVEDFIDKILYVAGVASSNVLNANYEDHSILAESLVRLTNAALALGLAVNISELTINRLFNQWKVSQITVTGGVFTALAETKFSTFVRANLEGISLIVKFDHQRLFTDKLMDFVKTYFINSSLLISCSSHSMNALIDILHVIVYSHKYDEMEMLSWLFQIFDASFQKLGQCTLLAQPNIEVKHPLVGIQNVYQNIAKCFDKLYDIFIKIIDNDLHEENFHNKLAFWTIYSRSLALGLNSNLNNNLSNGALEENGQNTPQSGGRDDDDDFEGAAVGGEDNEKNGHDKAGNQGATASQATTYHVANASQFVLFYRDFVTRHAPYLSVTRVQIKQTALKLLIHAMNQLLERSILCTHDTKQMFAMHMDLQTARISFQHSLDTMTPTTTINSGSIAGLIEKRYTSELLLSIPKIPIILFLQDLINLSCACATFTMNDKAILGFQSESMKLLCILLELFMDSVDPDYVDTNVSGNVGDDDHSQNKLVAQYLSQLLGAIRVCLTMKHFPELLIPSQQALFMLVQKGYIRDKVAFKRLLKPIMTYSEEVISSKEGDSEGSTSHNNGKNAFILPTSTSLNEVLSIHEHLGFLSSLAGLLLIANYHVDNHPFSHPTSNSHNLLGIKAEIGIKQTIHNTFSASNDTIISACKLVVIDLIRILYEQQQQLMKASNSPQGNMVNTTPEIAATSSSEFHPARGGWIYSSTVKVEAILQELIAASGILSLALCYSCNHPISSTTISGKKSNISSSSTENGINYKSFSDENVQLLFSYCMMMLLQLHHQTANNNHSSYSSSSNKKSVVLSSVDESKHHLLSSIWKNVLQVCVVLIDHPSVVSGSIIPLSSWMNIVQKMSTLSSNVWILGLNSHFYEFVMKFAKLVAKSSVATSTEVGFSSSASLITLWQLWKSRSKSVLQDIKFYSRQGDTTYLKALESLLLILAIQHKQCSTWLTPTTPEASKKISNILNTLRLLSIGAIVSGSMDFIPATMQVAVKGYELFLQMIGSQRGQNVEFFEIIAKEIDQLGKTAMAAIFQHDLQQVETQQAIFEVTLDAWMKLSALFSTSVQTPQIDIFFAIVLRAKQAGDHPNKSSALYRNLLQVFAVRVATPSTAPTLVNQSAQRLLLSLLLAGLNATSGSLLPDWEERVILVRLFLQLYNALLQEEATTTENAEREAVGKVEKFLTISLPVICKSINRNQREEQHCVLLGRALTLIARQSSESFRRLILTLSDEDKQYLQFAMKLAIQQEQQTTSSSGGPSSAAGPGIKSINMDKYRK